MSKPETTERDFILFDDRLCFEFTDGGADLIVTLDGVECVLWDDQIEMLRGFLAGMEKQNG